MPPRRTLYTAIPATGHDLITDDCFHASLSQSARKSTPEPVPHPEADHYCNELGTRMTKPAALGVTPYLDGRLARRQQAGSK